MKMIRVLMENEVYLEKMEFLDHKADRGKWYRLIKSMLLVYHGY